MKITTIKLVNFRIYAAIQLDLDADVVCFVGKNGVGKTNLLDAIHYLCIGKSYFNPIDSQNIKYGENFFRLEGEFNKSGHADKIVVVNEKGKRKQLLKNKSAYDRLSEHIGGYPLVVIAPDDLELINGGSEERRKFMDFILSFMGREYLEKLMAYNRLLHQRNATLKKFGEGNRFDRQLLKAYEAQMVPLGEYIHGQRQLFAQDFLPVFLKKYKFISSDKEQVTLNYDSDLNEKEFGELMEGNLQRDRSVQRTDKGIHKDDLQFLIDSHPVKKYGSQGQKKSFLIALKLAQYEYMYAQQGEQPLLLLDDLFDKLDLERAQQLINLSLSENVGQVFITDTQEERLISLLEKQNVEARIFKLDKGKLATDVHTE